MTQHAVTSFLKNLKEKHEKKVKTSSQKRKDGKEHHQQIRTTDADAEPPRKRHRQDKKQQTHHKDKHERRDPTHKMSVSKMKNDDGILTHNNAESLQDDPSPRSLSPTKQLPFPHKYILAPMVGASELAFRLLCRNYGVELAYTPMMSAREFALDPQSEGFQTCPQDRPLVCHFSANTPQDFVAAVQRAAPFCDAVDLNLGCPQRTAFLGHFGSYLLEAKDRKLVCDIVRAGASATDPPMPIFVKIRLLDTLEETIQLCQQLVSAGVSLIAIHARYRATWDRKGPGARDGPALLDQVAQIKKAVRDVPIIANGNVITFQDVSDNLASTRADGIMSAEGILDDPTLFLPRLESDVDAEATVYSVEKCSLIENNSSSKKEIKLLKKLKSIDKVERKLRKGKAVSEEKMQTLPSKAKFIAQLTELQRKTESCNHSLVSRTVAFNELHKSASNKILVAQEYLAFVRCYPVQMRSVIFHIRRMLKPVLTQYQLMEECLACQSLDQLDALLVRIEGYRSKPESFVFDRQKAQAEKDALERKRLEEGKRKAYEERMIRKAKREGKSDLQFYLHIGAVVPTMEQVERLKTLDKEKQLEAWKKNHSQHCMSFHLDPSGCKRDRSCAFLHVPVQGSNVFVESDEVAG